MNFLEVTTSKGKKLLINVHSILSIGETVQEDKENDKNSIILLSNGAIYKVKEYYGYFASILKWREGVDWN